MIFNMTFGSGIDCNIKNYESYASLPSIAQQNSLGIITDVQFTSYGLGKVNPFIYYQNATPGCLWICTSDFAPFGFNLLVNNYFQVYPVRAEQFIDNVWVIKDMYIYQSEWKPVEFALYKKGEENIDITGGWAALGKLIKKDTGKAALPIIDYEDNMMHIYYSTSNQSSIVYCANKIDLTCYKNLSFKGILYSSTTNTNVRICIWSSLGTYWSDNIAASALSTSNNISEIFEIDTSNLTGEYYIGIGMYGASANILIEEMILR